MLNPMPQRRKLGQFRKFSPFFPPTFSTAKNTDSLFCAISLDFEVANTTVTGITIQFFRLFERSKDYTPYKWVRCITYSNSYVCRV